MPQLVRSADRSLVMLLMPDGPLVERALHQVPIAALRVASNFQWCGISDLDEVAVAYRPAREPIPTELIDVELYPKRLDGAAFLKLTQALLWRSSAQNQFAEPATFKLLSRTWRLDRAKV
ncbi:hypothetical protein GA0061099_10287 [Bradyrhizobium yuanmingense]|uniref:Uncharacterized protein n=1 Tax=Bradyrhizobium yuanmingense TaxID=108015 RepID=A0A1C3XIZ5_9BRAD|nr:MULTISPECIES: hypothetical protein [Bradyrhizobium]TWI17821.1 hypothetical protein IQ15_07337 [Bradyrhizobium yuanmingense]SCB52169.1 hypothetical protein GA0061099_10287 [Bradyrhizobium yuanmingense]